MFADLALLPPDALLGLTKIFNEDKREKKIDLGVGVFRTLDGRTPILDAVKRAEAKVLGVQATKVYTPPEGAPGFADAVARLVLGEDSKAIADGRVFALQTPGGCGALRVGAELLKRAGSARIVIGSPTWANHQPLLSAAGLAIEMIPYYEARTGGIFFDDFMRGVEKLGRNDALLLHGGCHNPTGADLTAAQTDRVIAAAERQGFTPFVDFAYHGLAADLDADAFAVREIARRLPEALITYSCSKNFGLYRERTGALFLIGETAARMAAMKSHALALARGIYSMPPAHGGAIVAEILQSPELSALWRREVADMGAQIRKNRRLFVKTAGEMQFGDRVSFIERHNGMFSMLPLSETQVMAMRERYGVYMANSGRINLCGVNEGNVEYLCTGLRDVMRG
ncbi:MAG: aromatic amino acid transaminase [Parvularculaceae bacterium]